MYEPVQDDLGRYKIFPLPEENMILTSPYGRRLLKGKWTGHNGIDLGARTGTPIFSPDHGVVKTVNRNPDVASGMYVIINHADGTQSSYSHMSKIEVTKGQQVRRGEKIGEVGNTGNSTGSHLHWVVRQDGKTMDPLDWLPKPIKTGRSLRARTGEEFMGSHAPMAIGTIVVLAGLGYLGYKYMKRRK